MKEFNLNLQKKQHSIFLDKIRLSQKATLSPGERVYQRNYIEGHIHVLCEKYKVTQIAIGEEGFRYFAYNFVQKNPPTVENIDEYGGSFPQYLCDEEELEDYPQVGWLAQLDVWFSNRKPLSKFSMPVGTYHLWESLQAGKDSEEEWCDDEMEVIQYDSTAENFRLILAENVEETSK